MTESTVAVLVFAGIFYAFFGWMWAFVTLVTVAVGRRRALRIAWAAPAWPLGLLALLGWWIGRRALPGLAAAWREAWGKPEPTHIHRIGPGIVGEHGPEAIVSYATHLRGLPSEPMQLTRPAEPDTIPDEPTPPAGQWQQPPASNQAKPAAIPLQKPHLKHVRH